MPDLKYPIGKFEAPRGISAELRDQFIAQIAAAPSQLRHVVDGLTPQQLKTPYREGGWTVCQVVHHLPDSHFNAYARFKLAVTEDEPAIKPYDEAQWAKLADACEPDLRDSLVLLEALHQRWTRFLRSLGEAQFKRTYHHPESGIVSLDVALAAYAWHGRHHIAHIAELRKRMDW
ncbi:MAG: bacillithiol transferase BstA [Terriglobia bacterium]